VAAFLAGGSRYLWELARGEPVADYVPAAVLNPQYLVGADLSGPPFGSAIRHTVGTYTASNTPSNGVEKPALGVFDIIKGNTPLFISFPFNNRYFAETIDGKRSPYSRLYVRISWIRKAGATTPTVTIKVKNNGQERTTTATGPTGTETIQSFSDAFYAPVSSGFNNVLFEFNHTDATTQIQVTGLWLAQTVKRFHT
jgi:hypothetical protein